MRTVSDSAFLASLASSSMESGPHFCASSRTSAVACLERLSFMHPMGASETQRSNGSDIAQDAPRLEQADAEALIGDHGAVRPLVRLVGALRSAQPCCRQVNDRRARLRRLLVPSAITSQLPIDHWREVLRRRHPGPSRLQRSSHLTRRRKPASDPSKTIEEGLTQHHSR
jgi:hypothetical protein